jgi:5-methylcytosine-specific restriction protein A
MVLNAQPLCARCHAYGRTTIATDVHHIIALRNGGENTADNLQPLCHSCHSIVTRGETAKGRAV